MKKLTALLTALMALAMITGPSLASDFSRQLSPNTFGTGDIPDGVSYEDFGVNINRHYGVAPAWEGRAEEPRTMMEKEENVLIRHLAPNTTGIAYFADGVSIDEGRGTLDTHYGVAPAWEGRPEEARTMVDELNKHLAPNVTYKGDVF
ncbi:MAG: hypothetical protein ACYC0V_22190 [Armatimonadota bacterium]